MYHALRKRFLDFLSRPDASDEIRLLSLRIGNWRPLVARWIVFAYAILAGLAVSLLTYTTKWGRKIFDHLYQTQPFVGDAFIFIWIPTLTLILIWLVRNYAPGTIGSGIPQVIAAGHPRMQKAQYSRLVSLRISLLKIIFTTLSSVSGLSVGRQGPSVQIAAGILLDAKRWFPKISRGKRRFRKNDDIGISHDSLLVAGGAAGLAAAFNTPLAGILFAMEEMSQKLGEKNSPMVTISIVLSALVAITIFGNEPYLEMEASETYLSFEFAYATLALSLIGGLLGGLFSFLLISRFHGWSNRFMRWFKKHPYLAGIVCSLLVASLGYASGGRTLASDEAFSHQIMDGSANVDVKYLLYKYLSIWFSNISGVPGGIFSPSITFGAGLGRYFADLFEVAHSAPFIALGMVTFLSAVTQAPVTSFFIVTELLSGYSLILPLMASAIFSSYIARLFAPPFYSSLANYYVHRFHTKKP